MPGGFQIGREICNGNSVATLGASSHGTDVMNYSTAANTKSPWVQLTASAPCNCSFILINIQQSCAGPTVAIDIGVGAGGSEVAVISNLMAAPGTSTYTYTNTSYLFPLQVPAGTRISGRAQSAAANDGGAFTSIQLFDDSFTGMEGAAGVDSVGFVSGTTLGTLVDPGGTANTKGSYYQLTAASRS